MAKQEKKKYSISSIKEMPITSISFKTTEGNLTGDWRFQTPVLDYEKCNTCAICWMYCPETAIRVYGDRLEIMVEYCKGCGICAEVCPKHAISMEDEKSQ